MYGAGRGRNSRGERFRSFATRWLKDRERELRPRTTQTYDGMLRRHVLHTIGFVPLHRFDKRRIKELLDHLQEKGLGQTSRHHVFRLLHKMFSDAVAEELILKNPCEFKGPGRSHHRVQVLTEAQTRHVLAEAKRSNPRLYPLLLTAVSTALRQGELLGLTWENVDLERGTLSVVQALQRLPGAGWTLVPPKTDRSRRAVPLTLDVIAELRTLRLAQTKARLAYGLCPKDRDCKKADCRQWHDVGGFVFAQPNGKPGHGNNIVGRAFRGVLKRAGHPPMRLHVFGRHAYGSYLNRQGVDMATISSLVGHSSTAFTSAVYVHELPAAKREAAQIIGEVLGGAK
ncbi:MAG TPA: site-specific integrase [bacterium]|nr:site-specific integrase [bacterium]